MTEYFRVATERAAEAEQLRAVLDAAYEAEPTPHGEIGRINSHLKHCREMAGVYADLAKVQAEYDRPSR